MTNDRLAAVFMNAWMRRGALACLLWPLSAVFYLLIRLRHALYLLGWKRQTRLPVPVIVVGNIFVGGTGKTPLTIWLLNQLKMAGYRPGVISRGYGGENSEPLVVSAQSPTAQVGDEPVLIAQQTGCPVVVSRNRVGAGQCLLAAFPDVNVIISDDGLQHLALHRDIEIVLFDSRGAGNGWLLPAGPLREPMSRRRDFTVVNLNQGEAASSDMPADMVRMQLNANGARQLMQPDQFRPFAEMAPSLNMVAAAGIGNPERFFAMLRQHGLRFSALPLPDHVDYSINPFKNLSGDMILITEKDAVKCRLSKEIAADPRIWVVAVEAELGAGMIEGILKQLH